MNTAVRILKRNSTIIIGIIFCFIAIFCISRRIVETTEAIASNANEHITLQMDDSTIVQSWQANRKEIIGISLPVQAIDSITGSITVYLSETAQIDVAIANVTLELEELTGDQTLDFYFDKKIVLDFGTRYYFIIKTFSNSPDLNISIPINTNYYGGTLNDVDLNCAVSANIIYTKTNSLYWIFEILFIIAAFSLFFMLLFHKQFGEIIAMVFMTLFAFLYLFGIVGLLEAGVYAIKICAVILFVLSIFMSMRKKVNLTTLVSPSIFLFLIIFFLILLYNQNMYRSGWDEFVHWGLVVKDIFYFDSLPNHMQSFTIHDRYPPFTALLQYLFIYNNGVFTESFLFVAYQIVAVSFLFIMCAKIKWNAKRYIFPVAMIILLAPTIIFDNYYSTIYIDGMMAVIAAYILLCYYTEQLNAFNILRISMGLFALTLSKEVGLVIAGILVLITIVDTIVKEKKIFTARLRSSILFLAVIMITFLSWQIYIALPPSDNSMATKVEEADILTTDIPEGEVLESRTLESITLTSVSASGISMEGILELFTGDAPEYRYEAVRFFTETMLVPGTYNFTFFSLSYIDALLFLLLLSYFITRQTLRKQMHISLFYPFVYISIGGIIYAIFILITYLFAFPLRDVVILHSHSRYMGTYLLAAMLFLIGMIVLYFTDNSINDAKGFSKHRAAPIYFIIALIFIMTPINSLMTRPKDDPKTNDALYGRDLIAENFRSFADKTDSIYFICSDSGGHSYNAFNDAVAPMKVDQGLGYHIHTEKKDGQASIVSVSEWSDALYKGFDYVFIMNADNYFKKMYGELFQDSSEIQNGSIYKIQKYSDGNIILVKIGENSVKSYG